MGYASMDCMWEWACDEWDSGDGQCGLAAPETSIPLKGKTARQREDSGCSESGQVEARIRWRQMIEEHGSWLSFLLVSINYTCGEGSLANTAI
jgi:hypothetical protein